MPEPYDFRWLSNDEIEAWVNPVCKQQGWTLLNINDQQPTCRVLGAFKDGVSFVGFICLQMFPVIGPEWCDADHRNGHVSRELAELMHGFLVDVKARGALTICESPVSERFAKRYGMTKVEHPVYLLPGVE
jgi:hypothetical protein